MSRKLTPKQRVLRKYPCAYATRLWCVRKAYFIVNGRNDTDLTGYFTTPNAAWADAARRLSRRK